MTSVHSEVYKEAIYLLFGRCGIEKLKTIFYKSIYTKIYNFFSRFVLFFPGYDKVDTKLSYDYLMAMQLELNNHEWGINFLNNNVLHEFVYKIYVVYLL